MTDVLITIFAEFLYFQNYKISIFPHIWIFWRYANLKTVQILNSEILYVSRVGMYDVYIFMQACMFLGKHVVCIISMHVFPCMYLCMCA